MVFEDSHPSDRMLRSRQKMTSAPRRQSNPADSACRSIARDLLPVAPARPARILPNRLSWRPNTPRSPPATPVATASPGSIDTPSWITRSCVLHLLQEDFLKRRGFRFQHRYAGPRQLMAERAGVVPAESG